MSLAWHINSPMILQHIQHICELTLQLHCDDDVFLSIFLSPLHSPFCLTYVTRRIKIQIIYDHTCRVRTRAARYIVFVLYCA